MKRVLIASTALLLTAGAAAAEVKVGGDGRMGLHYDGEDWNFTSRVRVTFNLSAQTDSGLSFGGSFRADNAAGASTGAAGEVFISGAFGKLSMGDVDGAAESAVGNVSGVGLTGLGDRNDTFYLFDQASTADGDPKLLYSFSMNGFSFYASAMDGNGAVGGRGIPGHFPSGFGDFGEGVDLYAVGLAYSGSFGGGSYTVGIGYEHIEGQVSALYNEHIAVGGSVSFGDTTVKAVYGSVSGTGFLEGHGFGLSVDQKFGAFAATAFFRQEDYDIGGSDRWFGLGGSYDLGGGAKIVMGVVREELDGFDGETFADFGISLSF